jgi:hypothetical protein
MTFILKTVWLIIGYSEREVYIISVTVGEEVFVLPVIKNEACDCNGSRNKDLYKTMTSITYFTSYK